METLQGIELERLRWRSRRGLLENDLVLQNFYRKFESQLYPERVAGLNNLLDLDDTDLWDLLAGRSELAPGATPQAREVLDLLRSC